MSLTHNLGCIYLHRNNGFVTTGVLLFSRHSAAFHHTERPSMSWQSNPLCVTQNRETDTILFDIQINMNATETTSTDECISAHFPFYSVANYKLSDYKLNKIMQCTNKAMAMRGGRTFTLSQQICHIHNNPPTFQNDIELVFSQRD